MRFAASPGSGAQEAASRLWRTPHDAALLLSLASFTVLNVRIVEFIHLTDGACDRSAQRSLPEIVPQSVSS